MRKRVVTGIQPSGEPHLGNFLGMIRPALSLAEKHEAFYFIADYHALTTVRDRKQLNDLTLKVAATMLSLGLDPERSTFYCQSDVPEVFELNFILACMTPKGLLNRGHAYKSAADANRAAGRPEDFEINAGTFNYPVLMAADILLLNADFVPVGSDNRQHLEIARDIAGRLNRSYGTTIKPPQELINEEVGNITGLDGRHMSKSYGNGIPVFAEPKELERLVMRIVTDSKRPEEPKNPDTCNVFSLYKHFGSEPDVREMRRRYMKGGIAYSEVKSELVGLLRTAFDEPRRRYLELLAKPADIREILRTGARIVRPEAERRLKEIKEAVGMVNSLQLST